MLDPIFTTVAATSAMFSGALMVELVLSIPSPLSLATPRLCVYMSRGTAVNKQHLREAHRRCYS